MSYRKVMGRKKKLSRLRRIFRNAFMFQPRPQLVEHNGHWSGKAYDPGSLKKKMEIRLTDSES